ncbi:putative fructosyl amino acid protein [Podospora didyma]|uniref:Fructosyl amino acid protein n=1 Tax=Podospora didyma TaxID=330526 RepID=A0AAE0NHJ2_9PEZI|nr:putative fructosyl amino acid protein [Podospora didyma]
MAPPLPHPLPPLSPLPTSPFSAPTSILIIGSGAFGLSTALALAQRPDFSQSSITVIDRADPLSPPSKPDVLFPARDAASVDTSRVIRADYPDHAYAALAAEAQVQWRKQTNPNDLGAQGRYHESGLVLVADTPTVPPPLAAETSAVGGNNSPGRCKKTGMDYARGSWANVLSLASHDSAVDHIRELPDTAAIRDAVGTGGCSGSWGYVNKGSGWADAGAAMAWLFDQVKQTRRVKFVAGTVASLEHNGAAVTGAKLSDGRTISVELIVLAAGSWTGSLLDMAGQATATGQVMAYLDLTEAEQEQLGKMPVLLNLTTGLFIIPPANRVLKVARHAYGYVNPTTLETVPLPSSPTSTSTTDVFSHPRTHISDPSLSIPMEGAEELREALRQMIPLPELRDRPFSSTRLCWYMDTPTGDFLIDYHPHWKNLFVATGGSGHGFKFMPVIGEKITDRIAHNGPPEFKGKWDWKPTTGSEWESVITEDGSRGGRPGLILAVELSKGT